MNAAMAAIDPTARIEPGATIGQDVTIGPYCTIGANVTIGDGCRLVAHVNVAGHTTIGPRTIIYPFASLGSPPQSVKYRGGPTRLVVGADCDIRENVTMNIGTEDGGGVTEVGDGCFFMVGSHVAHDCKIGNNVTFANNIDAGGPRQRRRQRLIRRRLRGAPVRAHRRRRDARRTERRARRRHPLGHGAGPTGATGRAQRRRDATARLCQDRYPALSRGLSGLCFWATTANSARGSIALPQSTAAIALVASLIDFIRAGKRPLTMAGTARRDR